MAIWKLEPIEPGAREWAGSMHKGPVIVCAPTEEAARRLARQAFDLHPPSSAAEPSVSPWEQQPLARCSQLRESRFAEDGTATILDPPHYGVTPAETIA